MDYEPEDILHTTFIEFGLAQAYQVILLRKGLRFYVGVRFGQGEVEHRGEGWLYASPAYAMYCQYVKVYADKSLEEALVIVRSL